jgi:hypothetical protein
VSSFIITFPPAVIAVHPVVFRCRGVIGTPNFDALLYGVDEVVVRWIGCMNRQRDNSVDIPCVSRCEAKVLIPTRNRTIVGPSYAKKGN